MNSREMKKIADLLFSYFFVFASVITGGYALKLFYYDQYLTFFALLVSAFYLFGIGCMGLDRLTLYMKGECNNEAPQPFL